MSMGPSGGGLFTSSQRLNVIATAAQFLNEALPAGATVDIAGPAAGFVRIFCGSILAISNTLAAPLSLVVGSLVLPGPTTYRISNQVGAVATSVLIPALVQGPGEIVRVVNSGPNAGRLSALFYDVPTGNISLVRAFLTATPQTVIPQAPAGFFNRWLFFEQGDAVDRTEIVRLRGFNNDTISHSLEYRLGGNLFFRSAAAAAQAIIGNQTLSDLPMHAATGALEISTVAAIVTNPIPLLGAYQTFRG